MSPCRVAILHSAEKEGIRNWVLHMCTQRALDITHHQHQLSAGRHFQRLEGTSSIHVVVPLSQRLHLQAWTTPGARTPYPSTTPLHPTPRLGLHPCFSPSQYLFPDKYGVSSNSQTMEDTKQEYSIPKPKSCRQLSPRVTLSC